MLEGRARWIAPAMVVLALGGSIYGWQASRGDKAAVAVAAPAAERTFEFAQSDLSELTSEALGRRVPVSGTLKPLLQATVRSKVAAEVALVHVQEGDSVSAGKVLASLDTTELKARLDAQLANVAEARARLDLARKNEANNQQLLAKHFISQNAYDSALSSVQVAEANVQSAEAQAALAKRAMDDAQVRAPFSGIVAKRWVNQGDKVSIDMPVAAVVDLARMELETQVPLGEIPYVKRGQEIAFQVDGFPGRAFAGRIERVNPSAEPGSRSIAVFATLANSDGALKGGMFANGTLSTATGAEVNVIPLGSVVEEGGQTFVYVLRNGKVERRTVILGEKHVGRGLVVVKEGLERGVAVIAVKTEGLKPGAKGIVKARAKAA
jgi:RND family efflux transporter MFP subunit